MTLIIILLVVLITVLAVLGGFIIGLLKGLKATRPEVEIIEQEIATLMPTLKKSKLEVSYSPRERNELKRLADDLPVPDIRATLEARQRDQDR